MDVAITAGIIVAGTAVVGVWGTRTPIRNSVPLVGTKKEEATLSYEASPFLLPVFWCRVYKAPVTNQANLVRYSLGPSWTKCL